MQQIIKASDYRYFVTRIYVYLQTDNNKLQTVYYDKDKASWGYKEPKLGEVDFARLEAELIPLVYRDQLECDPGGWMSRMAIEDVTMQHVCDCSLHLTRRRVKEFKGQP